MKSLSQILKSNGQNPSLVFQKGTFEFDENVGCQVYVPPAFQPLDLNAKNNTAIQKSGEAINGSV